MMIYAHIYETLRRAMLASHKFICENDTVVKTKRDTFAYVAVLENGDEHHFISEQLYYIWKIGRAIDPVNVKFEDYLDSCI